MAISGDDFFEIELDNGELGYTRDGEFHINDQGELVTKQGYPVLGTTTGPSSSRRHWAEFHDPEQGRSVRTIRGWGNSSHRQYRNAREMSHVGGGIFKVSDPNAQVNPVNADEVDNASISSRAEQRFNHS